MTSALTDTGSLSLLVQFLDAGENYAWSRHNVVGLTAMLLTTGVVYPAPGIGSTHNVLSDDCDLLIHRLFVEGLLQPLDSTARESLPASVYNTLIWAEDEHNLVPLRKAVEDLHHTAPDYQAWMSWAVQSAMKGYAARHGGLIEDRFLHVVSRVVDISPAEARALHTLARDVDGLTTLFESKPNDFALVSQGYATSVMLRGLANDDLAHKHNMHIKHHPIRQHLLQMHDHSPESLSIANTAQFLIAEILRGALAQSTLHERIKVYAHNVARVRRLLTQDPGLLADKPSALAAEDAAKNIIIRAGAILGSKRVDHLITAGVIASGEVMLNLLFTTFVPAVGAGLAAAAAAEQFGVTAKAASWYHRAKRHFEKTPPSRIAFLHER